MKTVDSTTTSHLSPRLLAHRANTNRPAAPNPTWPSVPAISGPIGLGFRVPMLVISPFTRGGFVSSDTFDHTSVLRFLETRFGAEVPNLSAWRRATVGDLPAPSTSPSQIRRSHRCPRQPRLFPPSSASAQPTSPALRPIKCPARKPCPRKSPERKRDRAARAEIIGKRKKTPRPIFAPLFWREGGRPQKPTGPSL